MYIALNPQWVQLHNPQDSLSLIGNMNFVHEDNTNGFSLPLSPLDPVYGPTVTVRVAKNNNPNLYFYVHGENTVLMNAFAKELIVVRGDQRENLDLFEKFGKGELGALHLSLLPSNEDDKCTLRLSTGLCEDVHVLLPKGLYHFGSFVKDKNKQNSSKFFLNFSFPSSSLLNLKDVEKIASWKPGMKLEMLNTEDYIPEVASVVDLHLVEDEKTNLSRLEISVLSDGKTSIVQENVTAFGFFPAGYAAQDNQELTPPIHYEKESFNWKDYLSEAKAKAVPPYFFNTHQAYVLPEEIIGSASDESLVYGRVFEIEGEDKFTLYGAVIVAKPKNAKFGFKQLTNFGSGSVSWLEVDSDKIHPIGYHEYLIQNDPVYLENGGALILNANDRIVGSSKKSWEKILESYNFSSAPIDSFLINRAVDILNHAKEAEAESDSLSSAFSLFLYLASVFSSDSESRKSLVSFLEGQGIQPSVLLPLTSKSGSSAYSHFLDTTLHFLCCADESCHFNGSWGTKFDLRYPNVEYLFVSALIYFVDVCDAEQHFFPKDLFDSENSEKNITTLQSILSSYIHSLFIGSDILEKLIGIIQKTKITNDFPKESDFLVDKWNYWKQDTDKWWVKGNKHVCKGHNKAFLKNLMLEKIPEDFDGFENVIFSIDYSFNEISVLTQLITHLINIKLAHNSIEVIPDSIETCVRLKVLDISYNKIKKCPESLCKCTELEILLIDANPLARLPDNIGMLSNLKTLSASNTTMNKLPDSISNLKRLENLCLSAVGFSDIPTAIRDLPLKTLQLDGIPWIAEKNKDLYSLDDIASYTSQIFFYDYSDYKMMEEKFKNYDEDNSGILDRTVVQKLNADLIQNKIPKLIEFSHLTSMKNLTFLNLSRQGFKEIDDSIQNLENLENLDLSYNLSLENVSSQVGVLRLKMLNLSGCYALKTPPIEIVNKGFIAVMGYMKRLLTGSVECKRTKLMMIGLGGAGKTSLLNSLMDKQLSTSVTDGIDIATWNIPEEQLTFSAWDFAGQSVYYNTHQFFLTSRAVYLLLWNMRLGYEHAGLLFWLSSVRSHAPTAPIFVIGTHLDEIAKFSLPTDSLQKQFPQIVGFFQVSCQTKEGVNELRDSIIERTLQEWYMGEKIPKVWLDFERVLVTKAKRGTEHVSWSDFSSYAMDSGIVDEAEIKDVCQFLHELGSIQHFNKTTLKNNVVINPQWIVDVMKCVVSVKDSKIIDGKFFHEDVAIIWQHYPKDLHEWLLNLTEEFDLTFKVPVTENEKPYSLVPCLMPEIQPEYEWPLPDTKSGLIETRFIYKFPIVPAGLFNRAQVRLSEYSDYFSIWKKGSLLQKNDHKCLFSQQDQQNILIKVHGSHPQNLLYLVHEVVENIILESFTGVSYDLLIPCNDCVHNGSREPSLFPLSKVKRALTLKVPLIQCDQSFHSIPLQQIQAEVPTNGADTHHVRVQLESSVQQLKELKRAMSLKIYFCFCEKDDDTARKIMSDIENKTEFTCLTDLHKDLDEKNILHIKTSGAAVVCMSSSFLEDSKCKNHVSFVNNTLKKPMQLILLDDNQDWNKTPTGSLFAGDLYVSFHDKSIYDQKVDELIDLVRKQITGTKSSVADFPPCFISYCWSNSLMAMNSCNLTPSDEAIGWKDPRMLKTELEAEGIQCWMDFERVGGDAGLFEDIAEGLRHARVVVACLSKEYVKSKNCQMEFRFASTSLRLPIIVLVVGTKSGWKESEIGMLAMGKEEINMQLESPNAVNVLVGKLKEILTSDKAADKTIDAPQISDQNQSIVFQEMIELQQRKFLRQLVELRKLTGISETAYPRVFAIDKISEPTPEAISKTFGAPVCFRLFCESERGWHAVEPGVPLPQDIDAARFFESARPYLVIALKLFMHMLIPLEALKDESLVARLCENADPSDVNRRLQESYLETLKELVKADRDSTRGGLNCCQLPSGRTLWLCDDHVADVPGITIVARTDAKTEKHLVDEDAALLSEELAKMTAKPSKSLRAKFQKVGMAVGGAQKAYKIVSSLDHKSEEENSSKKMEKKEEKNSKVCSIM